MVTFNTVIRKSVFCRSISSHSVKGLRGKKRISCKAFLKKEIKRLHYSLLKRICICPSTVNPSTQILIHCEQVSWEKESHCIEVQQCRFLIACKLFLKRKGNSTYIKSNRLRIGV